MKNVWDKLDETLGAAMLMVIALTAIVLGYDGGVAQAAIAGIIALLAVSATKKRSAIEVIETVKIPEEVEE